MVSTGTGMEVREEGRKRERQNEGSYIHVGGSMQGGHTITKDKYGLCVRT